MIRVALIADTFYCRRAADRLRRRLCEAKQAGAQLAVLPEIPLNPWSPATKQARDDDAEPLGGPRCSMLSALAKELEIHVVGGAIIRTADTRHNTTLVYDDIGNLRGTYRKLHLPCEPGFWEGDHYEEGDELPNVIDSILPLGIQTCSDINRPEGSHILGALGAQLIACPRANEKKHYADWVPVFRANARCSNAFVVSVNRPIPEQSVELGGPSIAVDPSGKVLVESTDPVCTFDLDCTLAERAKDEYPGYLAVRARLYAQAWSAIAEQDETSAHQQLHCFDKVAELASKGTPTARDIFQIGYNMGRLQEMRADGREEWWDAYKQLVERGEWEAVAAAIERQRGTPRPS